jgi:hypothetical protein
MSKASLSRRSRRLGKEWSNLHAKRPRILYHYTDAQGLLGMLKTNRLWATNSRFMNDPTEVEYAARVVRETALEQEAHYPSTLFKSVKHGISEVLEVYEGDNDEYIACFCEEGDLLSQWRGYGAVGGGYALGFQAKHLGLREYKTIEAPEPVLRKVLYDQKKQKYLVRKFVKLLLDWETFRNNGARKKLRAIQFGDDGWQLFNWFVSECLNCFKDPAYAAEEEWRLIQYGRNTKAEKFVKTDFRASRNRIVEYVEIEFSKFNGKDSRLPIKAIRYGPTLDPKVTERALRLLCLSIGCPDLITVQRSGVPFSG